MARGRFPGKRVFLGGSNFRENGARKAFGGSVLNVISITDNASFYEDRGGGMTVVYIVPLTSPGRITVVYIYSTVNLPGEDNGSIYIATISFKEKLIMHGTIPQKIFISDFHSVYVLC